MVSGETVLQFVLKVLCAAFDTKGAFSFNRHLNALQRNWSFVQLSVSKDSLIFHWISAEIGVRLGVSRIVFTRTYLSC